MRAYDREILRCYYVLAGAGVLEWRKNLREQAEIHQSIRRVKKVVVFEFLYRPGWSPVPKRGFRFFGVDKNMNQTQSSVCSSFVIVLSYPKRLSRHIS